MPSAHLRGLFAACLLISVATLLGAPALRAEGPQAAPPLDGGLGWLNVSRPLELEELRGKVVLLDFWTFCCINCMHVIPDLKRLEAKHGDKLVVIGVHSAKFANEKDSSNIRQAILRYEIEHPVVNDADFAIWRSYGAQGWPTFVILDPEGRIAARAAGEGQFEILDAKISQLLGEYKGKLSDRPLPRAFEKDKVVMSELAFPGKVIADELSKKLFVSDSNHNRILVIALDGAVEKVIGSGKAGREDGAYAQASFNKPQGLALSGATLYVADTENHLVRAISLPDERVSTVLGNGVQSSDRRGGGRGPEQPINSPWDLAMHDGKLYIAMAGPHQIWSFDPTSGAAQAAFGSGREDIKDGPAAQAMLAQPSGIASDGKLLYFADAEVSAIRSADPASGLVSTLIGKGLFSFGDRDGSLSSAQLQHPLGVAVAGGRIYVADSYNHKIKELSPQAKTIRTLAGSGEPGDANGSGAAAGLFEPGGLAYLEGKLYIADTNNHLIRVLDPATGGLSSLELRFPGSPVPLAPAKSARFLPNLSELMLAIEHVPHGSDLAVDLRLNIADGYHLNPEAPSSMRVLIDGEEKSKPARVKGTGEIQHISLPNRTGRVTVEVETTLYYCKEVKSGVCLLKSYRFLQPIELTEGAPVERTIGFVGDLRAP